MVLEVRIERIKQGIKLWELAHDLNLDPQQWRRFEIGAQPVPPKVAQKAAKRLGVPVEGLFRPVREEIG